jgi:hypothetical protein
MFWQRKIQGSGIRGLAPSYSNGANRSYKHIPVALTQSDISGHDWSEDALIAVKPFW